MISGALRIRGMAGRVTTAPWEKVIGIVVGVVVIFLVAVPLLMLVFSSFRSTGERLPFEATAFTLANYVQVFGSSTTYPVLLNSLWYALGSITLGLTLTMAFAWLLERTNVPWRTFLFALVVAPMAIPGAVSAMAWILLANKENGLLNTLLQEATGRSGPGPLNINSVLGMILVSGLQFVPPMYLMISGTFSQLNPALEEASEMSGAGRWRTLWSITVALLRPGILAAAIYHFVLAIEVFEVPAMLGMSKGIFVFSTMIYDAVHPRSGLPNYGLASGYAMAIFTACALLIYVYSRATRRRDQFVVVTGRGYRAQPIDLGRWRYAALAAALVFFSFAVALPFFVLVWSSLVPYYSAPSPEMLARVSLNNYTRVLNSPGIMRTLTNTLVLVTMAPIVTMMLAALVARLSIRPSFRGGSIPDHLTFVVLGVPSIVMGLALMFVYLAVPIPIYGTVWIIVIGIVTRCLTYSTRSMGAAYLQVHQELEEASEVSGAPWWRTMGWVVMPLLLPSMSRGWIWVFSRSVQETTLALMLYTPGNETIAVRLWLAWTQDADIVFASTMAVFLVLILASLVLFMVRGTPRATERA